MDASSTDSVTEGEYTAVCSLRELQQLGKKRITLNERVVVLFHVKGEVYALDHFCYRGYSYGVMHNNDSFYFRHWWSP